MHHFKFTLYTHFYTHIYTQHKQSHGNQNTRRVRTFLTVTFLRLELLPVVMAEELMMFSREEPSP